MDFSVAFLGDGIDSFQQYMKLADTANEISCYRYANKHILKGQ